MSEEEIDTTLVECPEGCMLYYGWNGRYTVERQFMWYDGTVGTRNYCENCGSELVEATV